MKKTALPFIILMSIIFLACNDKYDNPQNYYDDIYNQYEQVFDALDSLDFLINDTKDGINVEKVEKTFDYAKEQIEQSESFVDKMGNYKGNDDLQKSTLELFKTINDVIETDYQKLFGLLKIPIEDLKDSDLEEMFILYESIDERIYTKNDKFNESKSKFIDEYEVEM